MSSATLPHVWKAILEDDAIPGKTLIVSLAFGPGLTLSGGILQKCSI
jgi:predicted naringenin-chalcone synthase